MKKCNVCGCYLEDGQERCPMCGAINVKEEPKEEKVIKEEIKEQRVEEPRNSSAYNAERVLRSVVRVSTGNSVGTGFVYNGNLVITNAHVISQVDNNGNLMISRIIRASFSEKYDRTLYLLEVLNIDVQEDVAILKFVDNVSFPSLVLADQSKVSMGEEVFTIGCPLGFDFSYVSGHVSNPNKVTEGKAHKVIQTDITVNHGNSGGPLCNMNCEVVGMVSFNEIHRSNDNMIDTPNGPAQLTLYKPIDGMSFAVTSDAIKECLKIMKMYR